MELKELMIKYRARERINQGELARRCGVSETTIMAIESGRHTPRETTAWKIRFVVEGNEEGEKDV